MRAAQHKPLVAMLDHVFQMVAEATGPELTLVNVSSGLKAACSAIAAEHTHLFAIDPAVSRDRRSGN